MFNEAPEADIELALRHKVSALTGSEFHYVKVDAEDFQTVKTQLFALGIIQQSERKRTASDTKTYWTLTPYGRHYTMTLKAIRSEDALKGEEGEA